MIDPANRYPTHLIDVVQLANGSRVVVRPALPQDCELQRVFIRTLSDEARYLRFMTRLSELPEAMATRFTSIDYRSHVALIATANAGESMIGEARYVVDEGSDAVCEFTVAVADAWQRMGLARTLLQRVANQAATSGIHHMVGDTVSSNKPMIALATGSGFAVARKREDGRLVRLVKNLAPCDQDPSIARPPLGECVVAT